MNKLIFGLLTLTALGAVSLPAVAGDAVNVQTSNQVTTQDGDGNTSYQRTRQDIRSSVKTRNVRNRRGGNDDSSGNVQDVYQDTYQRGYDNYNDQSSEQRVETRVERRDNRRSDRDYRGDRDD